MQWARLEFHAGKIADLGRIVDRVSNVDADSGFVVGVADLCISVSILDVNNLKIEKHTIPSTVFWVNCSLASSQLAI